MVTKVYCDHCGHTAPNAQQYIFGAHNYFFGIKNPNPQGFTGYIPSQAQQAQQVAQIQNQQNSQGHLPSYQPSVIVRAGSVDLCQHCEIIWMNRVKALTQDSEP